MDRGKFMQIAYEEAMYGMEHNHGGPFGAVVVIGNKIVGRGHNTVIHSNDPTAHAEINAIRDASGKLGRYHLEDAEIYTTCEPCPMCLSAIYWAKIRAVYYVLDRFDAEKIGFNDHYIYNELSAPPELRAVKFVKIEDNRVRKLPETWLKKDDRLTY
ncbi:MAG: nucleoside deaminase [Bacteroidales bacterium]|nr:nucleoside deaminase [Bacteroidales bacterium]